jgi:catechol 2,3-dioxygenase-like lactoylglutathione lyase family enzyme
MQVNAIDHVNILTDDLDGTAGFYERLLGLKRGETPGAAMGFKGAWMIDATGAAIVHIGWKDPARDYGAEHVPGAATGAFHHVAFKCAGYDSMVDRLDQMGVEYRGDGVARFGVRQLFLRDPNNINIELNFSGD